eukprot:EG_transcript_4065
MPQPSFRRAAARTLPSTKAVAPLAVGDVARTLRGVVDPEAAYQRLLIDSGQAAYNKITIEDCLFPGLTADDPAALPVPYINVATLLHNARRRVKVPKGADVAGLLDQMLRSASTNHIVRDAFWWHFIMAFGPPQAGSAAPSVELSEVLRQCYGALATSGDGLTPQGLPQPKFVALLIDVGLPVDEGLVAAALGRGDGTPADGPPAPVSWRQFHAVLSARPLGRVPQAELQAGQRMLFSRISRNVCGLTLQVPLAVRDRAMPSYTAIVAEAVYRAFHETFLRPHCRQRLEGAFCLELTRGVHRWLTGLTPGDAQLRHLLVKDVAGPGRSHSPAISVHDTASTSLSRTPTNASHGDHAPRYAACRPQMLHSSSSLGSMGVPRSSSHGQLKKSPRRGSRPKLQLSFDDAPSEEADPSGEAEAQLSPTSTHRDRSFRTVAAGRAGAPRARMLISREADLTQNLGEMKAAFKAMQRRSRNRLQELAEELQLEEAPNAHQHDTRPQHVVPDVEEQLLHARRPDWYAVASTQHGPPPPPPIALVPLHPAHTSPCITQVLADNSLKPHAFHSCKQSAVLRVVDHQDSTNVAYAKLAVPVLKRVHDLEVELRSEEEVQQSHCRAIRKSSARRCQNFAQERDSALQRRAATVQHNRLVAKAAFTRLSEALRAALRPEAPDNAHYFTRLMDEADRLAAHAGATKLQRAALLDLTLRLRARLRRADVLDIKPPKLAREPPPQALIEEEFAAICAELHATGQPLPAFLDQPLSWADQLAD